MTLGGYADKVGHVDLTAGAVSYAPIPEDWKIKYIGARGVGVKYVFENGPKVDPLSPGQHSVLHERSADRFSEANMSGRMAIVTKSPLTGTVTDSAITAAGRRPACAGRASMA